jgi:opacity protein-like surface antigen
MRKLLGSVLVALATVVAGPGQAADFPEYPPIDVPDVDYDVGGSFYLRGSAGLNSLWAQDVTYLSCPGVCGGPSVVTTSAITTAGYGYSIGAGFGYEVGNGLRVDATLDYLTNTGLTTAAGNTLALRSTIALANAYFDFPLGGDFGGMGGLGAYIGAGIGAAYNQTVVTGAGAGPNGATWAAVGALMAGVSYDMGDWVADVGYRGLFMPTITNGQAGIVPPALSPFYVNNAMIHEVRGTLRYRFN